MFKDLTWNGSSFWHATSTIFLKSIQESGLGAINPATDLKLLEVLGFFYGEIKRLNITHPVLEVNRASIEATMAQEDLNFNGIALNYKHDGVYVAASPLRAAIYARLNSVGSEVLEKCLITLSVLIAAGQEPKIPAELNVFPIRQYLQISVKPIMIEIVKVADIDLIQENGREALTLLQEMRESFPKLPLNQQLERLQFCNFKILKPIPIDLMRIYEVDFEGHPNQPNFKYYLTLIR